MNLWNPSLRPFALLAALAALSLPARADTLFYGGDDPWTVPTEYNGVAAEWPFEIYRGDASSAAPQQVKATSSNPAVVLVRAESRPNAGSSATVTLYKDPQTDPTRATYVATFYLVPQAAGNATITVQMTTDSSTAPIAFNVTVTGSSATRRISFPDYPDRNVIMPEANSRLVQFRLGSDVPTATAFQITCDKTDYDGKVSFPATVSVPSGNSGTFTIYGLDGSYSCGLTITDPNGNYDNALLNLMVTNVPPRIQVSSDFENPTPWGATVFKNQDVPFPVAAVGATDSAADQNNLTYRWSFAGSSTTDPNAVFTNSWSSPTQDGGYNLISITVSDGELSTVGFYSVVVQDSVTLYTDTTDPGTGLVHNGGVAQATTFRVTNPVGIDWALFDGTIGKAEVGPTTPVTLSAILEDGSYPFGWFGDTEYLRAPGATRVPNANLKAIVSMPDEGDATIIYLASYPYYHVVPGKGSEGIGVYEPSPLNNVWTDPFGDFDGDGLSDTWEAWWFQNGMEEATSENVTTIPVGIPTGDYGPSGNLDEDWLPTLVEETAPDAQPGAPKAGWPVVVTDSTTGETRTNRVFVLKYPLDFSTGGQTYNKSAAEEKPLFANFVEYRGLREDRTGGDGTDAMNLVRYAPQLVNQRGTYGDRNNCAGTDPNLLDTDTDGFSDGWEWYFWTTIKYGVHAENWRAWDPTYTYYSTASATAGFPLLETDDPLDFAFDVEPTKLYDIDPAAGTYLTQYVVDNAVLNDNGVVLPVVAGSVSIEFDGSSFTLFELSPVIARQVGVNPKDENGNSRLFYVLYKDSDGDGVPDTPVYNATTGFPEFRALSGAFVNDLSGQMLIPGWQTLTRLDGAVSFDIAQDTAIHVSLTRQNGLFPKEFLLSRFDPMNWDQYLNGDIANRISAAGFNRDNWDPTSDLDGDGVLDIEEYELGTDPLHWDTDRDGMPDGWEVQRGLLPLDPRNDVNGCGPGDNPDEDYMAYDATGTAKHADAYRADLANEVYWNGRTFTGYRPGRGVFPSPSSFTMEYEQGLRKYTLMVMTGFGGGKYGNLEEFLYSYYGAAHGFWSQVYPTKGDYNWASTTTDPCSNDTDGDGLPDGWEPYVGYSPIVPNSKTPEDLMEGIGYRFDPDHLEQPPICQGPPFDPDLDYDQDYDEAVDLTKEFSCLWANMLWPQDTTTTIGDGTEVVIHGFPAYDGWYNKWMPTDPWNADTDGDGLTDFQEYVDLADGNGDGEPKANFNPTCSDTDLDWLPDGWEYFMGLYAYEQLPNLDASYLDDEYGPFGDPDGDKLANYQEYLTGANYGWRHDRWYPLSKENIWVPQRRTSIETHKWDSMTPWDWPYDPGLYPQYGPTVRAHVYSPVDFFSVPVSGTTIARGMEALKALEKRWEYTVADSPSMEQETLAARLQRVYEIIYNPQTGRNIPLADGNPDRDATASLFLYDTDPAYDANYNYDGISIPGKKYFHHHSRAEHDAIVALFENVGSWIYSYAQRGYGWDLAGSLVSGGVYMPLNDNSTGYGFPGTRPRRVDSDNDGMPDYWEIYHGINPCYGGDRLLGKAGDTTDGDRADRDDMGDGSTDNWLMGCDPNYVLNLHFAFRPPYRWPIARKEKAGWWKSPEDEWVPYSFGDAITTSFGPDMLGNYYMEWAHFDLVNRPWLSGDRAADCDKDGVNNQEESYSFFANDLQHHTDPSPYWLTDMSQTVGNFGQNASHVNLYYNGSDYGAAKIWWWAVPFNGGLTDSPQYVWDFETSEGYDTDNNNIGDREELASVSTRGKTDPLDLDSPISRKAMYFDGHAACRTQRPFYHDQYALTSHTVEFWVRPHAYPAPGKIATLLHRPVMMPVDTLSGAKAWSIRNTFHVYMDETGTVFAQVDNDGIEQPANSAVVMSSGRLSLDKWMHVAVVMDSQNDDLTLSLGGEFAGHVSNSLKPCTGTIMSSAYREWYTANGGGSNGLVTVSTTTVNFDYSPAPIVVGAYETNPWGVVGGKLWSKTESQFDENRFFTGWIDEIRVWDRCRSQAEIRNNMMRRFTKDDIEPINRARWVWDKQNLYRTDAEANFPQKLLYHYSFDNLPDVIPDPARNDATTFFTDTDPVPMGWSEISSIRPVPFVPWWYVADNRSTAYATDFSYVPFIENTVGHLAQKPPRDISEIVPVYDEATLDFRGFRYRRSNDWAIEAEAIIESGGAGTVEIFYTTNLLGGNLGTSDLSYEYSGPSLLSESLLNNSMNPYGDGYNTFVRGTYEYNPWNFGGALDRYGVYEGIPIHSDMVPLLDAVADIDVPMWDGSGRGSENSAVDSDGDGIPDWWEIAHGLDPTDSSDRNGAYGDPDGDGLDNWAEYCAGTDPFSFDTDSDGYSDYYSRSDKTSLTYGELYDDGDGMDNYWELENGLDPESYDAHLDPDHDGWTNAEEFMAGTDPQDASSFPRPSLRATFHYDGEAEDSSAIVVHTFGERSSGDRMGGAIDGKYSVAPNISYGRMVFGADGVEVIGGGNQYYVTHIPYGHVAAATLDFQRHQLDGAVWTWVDVQLPLGHANEEYGLFVSDIGGVVGLDYETGTIFCSAEYAGRSFQLSTTIDGHAFPFTEERMLRTAYTHLIGGWNRFFGFIDVDHSGDYTVGEPAGISTPRPVYVGWDRADVEIPFTDELYGFPRFSWPAATNENVNAYKVYIWNGSGQSALVREDGTFVNGIVIDAPRTYIHEGDFIRHGVYGINGGTAATDAFSWTVASDNGLEETVIAEGTFVSSAVPNVGARRAMSAKNPISYATVNGAVVELQWEMDWRNAGVNITIEKVDGADAGVKIDNLCVPLPIRHGKSSSLDYYYTAKPQLESGKSFVSLSSGTYRYRIVERPKSSAVSAQSVEGYFRLVNDDSARDTFSVSGDVKYFGKVMQNSDLTTLGTAAAGATDFSAVIPAAMLGTIAGSGAAIQLRSGSDVVCTFSASGTSGILIVDGSPDSLGWSGSIDYETGRVSLLFDGPLSASYKVVLVARTFASGVPLVVRAYQVPDDTRSGLSLAGTPSAQTRLTTKGAYSVTGLKQGTYVIHAFLDSNKNGFADEWETQGYGLSASGVAPILDARYDPIVVDANVTGVTIVLHDRDTDNDLLPDAWEWWKFGNLATSGYDQKSAGVYVWEEYADGVLDSDPRTPDTDLDGLTDAMEIKVTRTDTHRRDTDGDGIGDLEEFLSGSDPLDPADARPFTTPALAFDADGVPYVECAYPSLVPGVVLTYTLQRKLDLAAPAWEDVAELEVAATDAATVALADGVMSSAKPAGTAVMKPADQADIDYRAGFFRIRVSADYGKMVDNEDGTCSYMTWMPDSAGVWSWTEAARGTGTLVRDADGTWSFVSDATGRTATLVRDENGNWTFQE